MVYRNEFIAVVKTGGKVLRESCENGEIPNVFLPFGSEYTIFLKNESSKRSLVKVQIDGEDVLNGKRIIVHPNNHFELFGFLNDHGVATHKFKFVERTEAIINHQGDKVEHGMVKIQYAFERRKETPWYGSSYDGPIYSKGYGSPVMYGIHDNLPGRGLDIGTTITCSEQSVTRSCQSDIGVTVHGSNMDHQYSMGCGFDVDDWKTVMMRLMGYNDNQVICRPITKKTKITCPICGTVHQYGVKYCSECGNNLV